jgi:hypothetical protein
MHTRMYMCVAPPSVRAKVATIRVQEVVQDLDARSYSLAFEYEEPIRLASLLPLHGGWPGGTRVSVFAFDFRHRANALNDLFCNFNLSQVSASHSTVLSTEHSTKMSCASPRHQIGVVSFEVTTNNQQFSSSGLLFTFGMLDVQLLKPDSGPRLGGTFISVMISTLPRALVWHCSFGAHLVAASVQSRFSLLCSVPTAQNEQQTHMHMHV